MSEDNYSRLDNGQLLNYFHKKYPDTTRYELKDTDFPLWDEFRKRKLMLMLPLKIEPKLDERVLALRPRIISEPDKQELPKTTKPALRKIKTIEQLPYEPAAPLHSCHDHYVAYTVSRLNGVSRKQLAEINPVLYASMVHDGTIEAVPTKPYNGDPVQFSIDNYGRLHSSNELKHTNPLLWKELYNKGLLHKVIKPISKKMAAS